jgi:hypothetical protein
MMQKQTRPAVVDPVQLITAPKMKLLGVAQLALAAFTICLSAAAPAKATSYYVSPSGNNTTGLSYQTAWTELDKIDWSKVKSNDAIYIDGGQSGLTYKSALTVPARIQNVTIDTAYEGGHAGQVTIDGGQSSAPVGITLLGTAQISTIHPAKIKVQHWKYSGLLVEGNGTSYINRIEAVHNPTGIYFKNGGSPTKVTTLSFASLHDNTVADITNEGYKNLAVVSSWIYNSAYPSTSQKETGINLNGDTYTSVSGSIVGPGLAYGVKANNSNGFQIFNSTLIDATVANLSAEGKGSFTVFACTSFMTRLNPSELAHACVDEDMSSGFSAADSIFYGGEIIIPASAGSANGGNNTIYNVTGNTTALAPTQVNPPFATNLGAFPDSVPINTLIDTDYKLATPADRQKYGGAMITSVQDLLNGSTSAAATAAPPASSSLIPSANSITN